MTYEYMAMSEWLKNHPNSYDSFEDEGWEFYYGCLRRLIRGKIIMNMEENTKIQRFTVYRKNMSNLTTHNHFQKNADDMPQYEGVIWTDGTVTLRWLTACKSTSVWNSLKECLDIHGHPEYGTFIVWHDNSAPQEWVDKVNDYQKKLNEL